MKLEDHLLLVVAVEVVEELNYPLLVVVEVVEVVVLHLYPLEVEEVVEEVHWV